MLNKILNSPIHNKLRAYNLNNKLFFLNLFMRQSGFGPTRIRKISVLICKILSTNLQIYFHKLNSGIVCHNKLYI